MTSLLNFIKIYQLAGRSTVLEPLLCSVEWMDDELKMIWKEVVVPQF
jgi:hypothetical protein